MQVPYAENRDVLKSGNFCLSLKHSRSRDFQAKMPRVADGPQTRRKKNIDRCSAYRNKRKYTTPTLSADRDARKNTRGQNLILLRSLQKPVILLRENAS